MTTSQIRFAAVVALIAAFVLGAKLAGAGTWEEFRTRCLLPMEDIQAPITDGLDAYTPSDEISALLAVLIEASGVNGPESYVDPEAAFSMIVSDAMGCMVFDTVADAGDRTRAAAWREAVLASDRYEPGAFGDGLLSTTWREPRLSVSFVYDAETHRAVFIAQDTDLES